MGCCLFSFCISFCISIVEATRIITDLRPTCCSAAHAGSDADDDEDDGDDDADSSDVGEEELTALHITEDPDTLPSAFD